MDNLSKKIILLYLKFNVAAQCNTIFLNICENLSIKPIIFFQKITFCLKKKKRKQKFNFST